MRSQDLPDYHATPLPEIAMGRPLEAMTALEPRVGQTTAAWLPPVRVMRPEQAELPARARWLPPARQPRLTATSDVVTQVPAAEGAEGVGIDGFYIDFEPASIIFLESTHQFVEKIGPGTDITVIAAATDDAGGAYEPAGQAEQTVTWPPGGHQLCALVAGAISLQRSFGGECHCYVDQAVVAKAPIEHRAFLQRSMNDVRWNCRMFMVGSATLDEQGPNSTTLNWL